MSKAGMHPPAHGVDDGPDILGQEGQVEVGVLAVELLQQSEYAHHKWRSIQWISHLLAHHAV